MLSEFLVRLVVFKFKMRKTLQAIEQRMLFVFVTIRPVEEWSAKIFMVEKHLVKSQPTIRIFFWKVSFFFLCIPVFLCFENFDRCSSLELRGNFLFVESANQRCCSLIVQNVVCYTNNTLWTRNFVTENVCNDQTFAKFFGQRSRFPFLLTCSIFRWTLLSSGQHNLLFLTDKMTVNVIFGLERKFGDFLMVGDSNLECATKKNYKNFKAAEQF